MSKKKLLILPIIAIVVAIMGMNVWAVPGSQQNWVKIYKDGEDVTANFNIEQISDFSGPMAPSNWKEWDEYQAVYDMIKDFDKNLTPDKFMAKVAYEIEAKPGYTVKGDYKVVIQSACADNEIWVFSHGYAEDVAVGIGGKNLLPQHSSIRSFSPFYVFTATSKTSPQTGDFAPAYIAMVGVALVTCGAIFVVRAKKASKEEA